MSGDDNGGLRNTIYRNTTRSSRRMTWWRRLLYRMAVPLVFAIIRAWFCHLPCGAHRGSGSSG